MDEQEYKTRKETFERNIKYHERHARIYKEDLAFLEERYAYENRGDES